MPTAGGTGIAGGLVMPQSRYFRPRGMPRPINQGSQIQEAGKSIGTAIEGFGDLFRKIRQDKIANDLMNQGDQSQAAQAMSSPDIQSQGTLGDEPLAQEAIAGPQHTGGIDELNMRQAYQKAQTAQALEEAKLADYQAKVSGTGKYAPKPGYNPQAGAGSTSRWLQQAGGAGGAGKAQKSAAYVAGSSDPNDPSSDDMKIVRADYDNIHGKGSFDKAQQNIGNWQVQNGQYVLPGKPDAQGNPTYTAQMSVDEGNKWILRTNAARMAQGLPQLPVPVPVPGSNPKSTDPPGSLTNPYKPTTALESRGIPNDSYLVDPSSGQIVHKVADPNYKKPQAQAQAQATAQPQTAESVQDSGAAADTSSTGTEGLGDEELSNEATSSAGQDTDLEDQIAQAKAKRDLYA